MHLGDILYSFIAMNMSICYYFGYMMPHYKACSITSAQNNTSLEGKHVFNEVFHKKYNYYVHHNDLK